jgi:LacI family transcriptional regulator
MNKSNKRITIDQIAKLANVSKTTVSRIINHKPDVDEITRNKVLKIMEEYDYYPNVFARAMSTNRSNNIGLLILYDMEYVFSNPFYTEVMRGISTEVHERGYYLVLTYLKNSNYENLYKQKRVDGYIVMSPGIKHYNIIKELIDSEAPFISTANIDMDIPWVDIDNYQAAYKMTEHLISLGHKRIVFVGLEGVVSSKHRFKGFSDCMKNYGIEVDNQLIRNINIKSSMLGYNFIIKVMSSNNPPTAAFLAHDVIALKSISAINALGLSIPDDISVAGFDDIAMAEFTNPPLTTIKHPAFTKGLCAARVFLNYLEEKAPIETVLMDYEFVQRESTGPKKKGY